MSKTSSRVAPIDRAAVMRHAHSLYRRQLFDTFGDALKYAWRVAKDRRDLAAHQSQPRPEPPEFLPNVRSPIHDRYSNTPHH